MQRYLWPALFSELGVKDGGAILGAVWGLDKDRVTAVAEADTHGLEGEPGKKADSCEEAGQGTPGSK